MNDVAAKLATTSAPLKPVWFQWTGEEMKPLSRFAELCDRQFVIGERYLLSEEEQRSLISHGHYFVVLGEYYHQLPEALVADFPTFEHFRKKLLIRAGFYDERAIVCESERQAEAIAALAMNLDDFAVVVVAGVVVKVFRAKSQRMRAMGRKDFQASKDAVLQLASDIVGIAVEDMKKHAGKAA